MVSPRRANGRCVSRTRVSARRVVQIGKFYPPHHGGIESHLELICRHLRRTYDVRVLVSSDGRTGSEEVRDGIPVRRLPTPFSITSAPVNPGLAAAIRAAQADLVHLHVPHPGAVLSLLQSGYKGPLVVTYHSDVVRQRLMSAVFQPFLDACLSRATAILVTSSQYMETSTALRRHRHRCRVVPLGIPVDAALPRDDPRVQALRATFGDRIVLAAGRFVYYKGFDVLLEAMRSVEGRLLLVGDGPERPALEDLARRMDVQGKVSFMGTVDDLAPFFSAADVFAFPSTTRAEAFGIVQLEAMAAGTPVVNTNLPSGVPWVCPHDVSGLTVQPNNATELARAIGRLLDDGSLRSRLGAAGRQRARDEFSDAKMLERIGLVYDEAFGRSGAAR